MDLNLLEELELAKGMQLHFRGKGEVSDKRFQCLT